MLRKLTAAVFAIHPSGQAHSRSSIERSPIPVGIRHFLLSTLNRRAALEARELLQRSSPWFDESDADYAGVMEQTVHAFSGVARFPAQEWDRAVSQACEQVLDYLVAPASTMARFVAMTGSETTPASDLRRKTGYFRDYPYLGKSVDAWLTRKGKHEVSRSEFETAMLHLDAEMTASHDAAQWMGLLQPLSRMMVFAGIDPPGLPVALASRFFDEKRKPVLSDTIAHAAKKHRADMITMTSLERLIRDALDAPQPSSPSPSLFEPEKPDPMPAGSTSSPSSGVVTETLQTNRPSEPPTDEGPLPLWKRFQQQPTEKAGKSAAASPPGSAAGSRPNIGQEAKRTAEGQPLWKQFERTDTKSAHVPRDPASKNAPAGTSDSVTNADEPDFGTPQTTPPLAPIPVREAMKLESRHVVLGTASRRSDRYIRDLFEGNERDFSDVMDDLAGAPDWTTASRIIADRVFRPYKIDIYSDVAVDFTNVIEARYSGTAT